MFSLPPENFLTLFAPGFFGGLGTPVYWGRCYLWEMSLFFGAVGPLLPTQDRWATIAYLRALQLSWLGSTNELTAEQTAALK